MHEVRFRARSNKKACPKLSFPHVVWKNSVRYTGEKVILSSCVLFTNVHMRIKSLFRTCIENNYFNLVYKILYFSWRFIVCEVPDLRIVFAHWTAKCANWTHYISTAERNNVVSRRPVEERFISSNGWRTSYLGARTKTSYLIVYWSRTGRKSAEIRSSSSARRDTTIFRSADVINMHKSIKLRTPN